MTTDTTAIPEWVTFLKEFGVGTTAFVFAAAVLWSLLPAIKKVLLSWARQADALTKSLPSGMETIGNGVEALNRLATSAESIARQGCPLHHHGSPDVRGDREYSRDGGSRTGAHLSQEP